MNAKKSGSQAAKLWSQVPAKQVPGTTPIDERFWKLLPPGSRVLEVGCGDGRILRESLGRGFKTAGIDINASAIATLERELAAEAPAGLLGLSACSIVKTPFADSSFDAAIAQAVPDALAAAERLPALLELRRVLAPGGIVHIADFALIEGDEKARLRYEKDALVTGEYGTLSIADERGAELYRTHNFAEKELLDLIASASFELVSLRRETFISYHGNRKPGFLVIIRKPR